MDTKDPAVTHLKAFLQKNGFKMGRDAYAPAGNLVDWYAWRRTTLLVRPCETNGDRCQIVIHPFSMVAHGIAHTSTKVGVTGETNGVWYELSAYSLPVTELIADLDDIERRLVSAWNALQPISPTPVHPVVELRSQLN